jgi:hypothetical protein
VVIEPVGGGAPVTLSFAAGTGTQTYTFDHYFSPGGRWLVFRRSFGTKFRFAIGDTRAGGTFVESTDLRDLDALVAGTDDFVAFRETPRSISVAPLPLGMPVTLLPDFAYPLGFQNGSARLAAYNNREYTTYVSDLEIHDVTTRTRVARVRDIQGPIRPGFDLIRFPFWAGRLVVFTLNARMVGSQAVFDLGAVTEDGAVMGTLATDVVQYQWNHEAGPDGPRRLLFTRSRAAGGGLWTLLLPAR